MGYKLLIIIVTNFLLKSIYCDNCTLPETIQIRTYSEIDSEKDILTVGSEIAPSEDLFQLIIANQTLPKICENYINIENELSVLQIINSSVTDIVPGAFNITPSLTLLRIVLNNIPLIRNEIFNNIRVKEIDLSNNQIVSIEQNVFDNIPYLEIVNLNYNLIKEINPDWFFNSPNVYKLSAIYNDIRILPANVFKNMATIRPLKLQLSANRITEIDPEILGNHTNIELLRINGNRLQQLPDNLFVNQNIKRLHVNLNALKCFPNVLFNSSILELEFIENDSFQCDCLKKVRKFVKDNGVKVLYPSIICEDKTRGINIVYNHNTTVEIPVIPGTAEVDVYVDPEESTTN